MNPPIPTTGLVLTGGGARAAYQVGVLKALTQIRRDCHAPPGNPFPVITGTSAGAINAAALACGADDFDGAIDQLCDVWENFHAEQVYRADSIGVIRTGARWLTMMSIGWVIARWRRARPRSLLDNAPLEQLLNRIYLLTVGQGQSPDGQALVFIADRLRSGIVPADLRAAFYEAAALIPGVTIVESQATLDGRTGVAIGRDEGSIERQEIIIDPSTGLYIGERLVTLAGMNEIPSGTVVSWSAVTTSVTDSALLTCDRGATRASG